VATAALWIAFNAPAPPAPADRIAVLPFVNISADQDDEYFADGLTEELISNLSKIRDLNVIARTSVFKYKNAGRPGERGEGFYFDVPVEITDPVVSAWLREKPPGMVQLPVEFIAGVEALASDPANGAKRFA